MARPSLGKNKPTGGSPRFEMKHTQAERDEVKSVLLPGEDLSKFTREAWKLLVAKRKRQAKNEEGSKK